MDSLNFLMTQLAHNSYVRVYFATKHDVLIIEAAVVLTPYCLSSLGFTANQISLLACIDVGLHTGSAYIEEKVVYVGNIPGKTIQWETWNKYCSIIFVCIVITVNPPPTCFHS